MKIIILHGEDISSSYERLIRFIDEAKRRDWDIIKDSLEVTPTLFSRDRLIIVRNLNLLDKKSLFDAIKTQGTLVIYHEGNIPKTILDKIPKNSKIEKFDLPRKYYFFLNSFFPGNANTCLKLFHDLTNDNPIELIFFLFSKYVKDMFWSKIGTPPIASWQLSKLKAQAGKFDEEALRNTIKTLADIDIQAKTGGEDLKSSLDLLIVKTLAL